MESTWSAARQVVSLFVLLLLATATPRGVAQQPPADTATVTYSYPHPPDEPGWNGAFQDPDGTKLVDGIASGNARHSVIWAATTDERFIDVELGSAVVLEKAGRLLDELRDEIVSDLEEYERRGLDFHTDSIWPGEKYDDWRKRIAQMIVRLQSVTSIPQTPPRGR